MVVFPRQIATDQKHVYLLTCHPLVDGSDTGIVIEAKLAQKKNASEYLRRYLRGELLKSLHHKLFVQCWTKNYEVGTHFHVCIYTLVFPSVPPNLGGKVAVKPVVWFLLFWWRDGVLCRFIKSISHDSALYVLTWKMWCNGFRIVWTTFIRLKS